MPPMLSLLPPGRQEPQKGLLDGVLRERAANNGNFISPAITSARVQLRARRIGGESGIVHYVRTVASKHMPAIEHVQASSSTRAPLWRCFAALRHRPKPVPTPRHVEAAAVRGLVGETYAPR